MITGYKFLTKDLKSMIGKQPWAIGEWRKCTGCGMVVNGPGYHAARTPMDSLHYIYGSRWFEIEAQGNIAMGKRTFCASEMRLIREIPEKVLIQFSIDCHRRALPLFEKQFPTDDGFHKAIELAETYLQNPTDDARIAVKDTRKAAWESWWALPDTLYAAKAITGPDWSDWDGSRSRRASGDDRVAAGPVAIDAWWAIHVVARAVAKATYDTTKDIEAAANAGRAELSWQNQHLLELIKGVNNGK
jgi:hypothetical protein